MPPFIKGGLYLLAFKMPHWCFQSSRYIPFPSDTPTSRNSELPVSFLFCPWVLFLVTLCCFIRIFLGPLLSPDASSCLFHCCLALKLIFSRPALLSGSMMIWSYWLCTFILQVLFLLGVIFDLKFLNSCLLSKVLMYLKTQHKNNPKFPIMSYLREGQF